MLFFDELPLTAGAKRARNRIVAVLKALPDKTLKLGNVTFSIMPEGPNMGRIVFDTPAQHWDDGKMYLDLIQYDN